MASRRDRAVRPACPGTVAVGVESTAIALVELWNKPVEPRHTESMGTETSGEPPAVQPQLEAIRRQMTINRADIDELLTGTEVNDEEHADVRQRIDQLETHVNIDRELILELHEAGMLQRQRVEQLEQALRTSRTIGAAIGIIMASRSASQDEAFALLRSASQRSNRKLRDLADEVVQAGSLPSPD